jgi:hypothetical protein
MYQYNDRLTQILPIYLFLVRVVLDSHYTDTQDLILVYSSANNTTVQTIASIVK